jgi:hypothetical protein
VADQSLVLELLQRRPALLDVLVGVRPVDLVEVDRVHAEPREARLRLAADRIAVQVEDRPAAGALQKPDLGEDVGSPLEPRDRPADDLLRVTEAVDRCRVPATRRSVRRS